MPTGRTHAAITVLAAGGLYYLSTQAGYNRDVTIALAGGCMAGVLITPDLDVNQPVRSHYVVKRKLGSLAAAVWWLAWYPYGRAINHRSWISHAPVIGTALRLAYMGLIAWLVLVVTPGNQLELVIDTNLFVWFALGLTVSDVLHWLADISFTRIKTIVRKRANGQRAKSLFRII